MRNNYNWSLGRISLGGINWAKVEFTDTTKDHKSAQKHLQRAHLAVLAAAVGEAVQRGRPCWSKEGQYQEVVHGERFREAQHGLAEAERLYRWEFLRRHGWVGDGEQLGAGEGAGKITYRKFDQSSDQGKGHRRVSFWDHDYFQEAPQDKRDWWLPHEQVHNNVAHPRAHNILLANAD